NQALTHKEGGSAWHLTLGKAAHELEEFILENEGGDEEALLGAYYGYLLKGRVHAAKGEPDEAEGFFTSVLDQDIWGQKLPPLVQALVERTYFHLLEFLNDTG